MFQRQDIGARVRARGRAPRISRIRRFRGYVFCFTRVLFPTEMYFIRFFLNGIRCLGAETLREYPNAYIYCVSVAMSSCLSSSARQKRKTSDFLCCRCKGLL